MEDDAVFRQTFSIKKKWNRKSAQILYIIIIYTDISICYCKKNPQNIINPSSYFFLYYTCFAS